MTPEFKSPRVLLSADKFITKGFENKAPLAIIITAYNNALFIREMCEGVARQDFDDFFCIVLDDKSLDDTTKIVASFINNRLSLGDTRFILAENAKNVGALCSRLGGIELALGLGGTALSHITFLDGDDTIEAGYIENLMGHAGVVASGATLGLSTADETTVDSTALDETKSAPATDETKSTTDSTATDETKGTPATLKTKLNDADMICPSFPHITKRWDKRLREDIRYASQYKLCMEIDLSICKLFSTRVMRRYIEVMARYSWARIGVYEDGISAYALTCLANRIEITKTGGIDPSTFYHYRHNELSLSRRLIFDRYKAFISNCSAITLLEQLRCDPDIASSPYAEALAKRRMRHFEDMLDSYLKNREAYITHEARRLRRIKYLFHLTGRSGLSLRHIRYYIFALRYVNANDIKSKIISLLKPRG